MLGYRVTPLLRLTARPGAAAVRLRLSVGGVTAAMSLALGLAVWLVHRPGIANHDGLWLYDQGVRGTTFEDIQPVYIAVAVSLLAPLGVTFGFLTLAQAMLLGLGIQRAAAGAVRTAARVSERTAHLTGLATLALLLLPVTPLAWYLVYFGSDGWLQTAFVWFAVAWLGSYPRFPAAGPGERLARAGGLTALAGAIVLIRPNAMALLPVFAGLIVALHGRRRWRAAAAWCLILVAVRPVAGGLVYSCYRVDRSPPGDPVMAHDLVGIAVIRPEALADLPITAESLDGDRYRTGRYWGDHDPLFPWGEPRSGDGPNPRYTFGNVDPLYPWGFVPVVKPGYAMGAHDRLAAEYRRAVVRYPGTLAVVKVRAFLGYLLDPEQYWHNTDLDPNELGLAHRPNRPVLRALHLAIDRQVQADPGLRWVSRRHIVWFLATVVAVAGLGTGLVRRPNRAAAGLFLLLLVPLGYYLTFLVAINGIHFRFMYPATLLAQTVLVGVLLNTAREKFAGAVERMAAPGEMA
jgi:hypothetical protein